MNWSVIWELFKINLLYSNPQSLVAIRNKQAKHPNKKITAYKSMLFQQLFLSIFIGFLYSFIFFGIDFSQAPGLFTTYLLAFVSIANLSAFPAIFTVFYDSKDNQLYLPLPIKARELLVAKTLATLGMALSNLMPVLGILIFLYWRLTSPIIAVSLGIFNFLLLTLFVISISIILVNLLGRLLIKSPYKKLISSALIVLSQIISFLGIMFINSSNSDNLIESGGNLAKIPMLPLLSGFYHIVKHPFSLDSIIHYWSWGVILSLFCIFINKYVIPTYYKQLWQIDNGSKIIHQRQTKDSSITYLWIKHHLSTLKIPGLWANVFVTSMLFIFILIGPLFERGKDQFIQITPDFFGIPLIFGLGIGLISTILTTVGISLERDNYTFIKSLPVNFKQFLKTKFWVLYSLQVSIPIISYSLVAIFLELHPLLTLSLIGGILLGSLLLGQYYYRKDFKNLMLNWQNINQLLTRGNNNFIQGILAFVGFIIFAILLGGIIILSLTIGALTVSLSTAIFVLIITIPIQIYFNRHFWNKL